MKPKSRPAPRSAGLCLKVGVLLTSLACGRIDLGSAVDSEPVEEPPQSYPPPQITLGPVVTRVEIGSDPGTAGGDDVTVTIGGLDASVSDAEPGTSEDPIDAGRDAEAP
jgi:hypothetical protein